MTLSSFLPEHSRTFSLSLGNNSRTWRSLPGVTLPYGCAHPLEGQRFLFKHFSIFSIFHDSYLFNINSSRWGSIKAKIIEIISITRALSSGTGAKVWRWLLLVESGSQKFNFYHATFNRFSWFFFTLIYAQLRTHASRRTIIEFWLETAKLLIFKCFLYTYTSA